MSSKEKLRGHLTLYQDIVCCVEMSDMSLQQATDSDLQLSPNRSTHGGEASPQTLEVSAEILRNSLENPAENSGKQYPCSTFSSHSSV